MLYKCVSMVVITSFVVVRVCVYIYIYIFPIPAAVLHRPEAPQSDNYKKWAWIQVQEQSHHQPPPLHRWHQAVRQKWTGHWLTDPPHLDLQWGHWDVILTREVWPDDSWKKESDKDWWLRTTSGSHCRHRQGREYHQRVRQVLKIQLNGKNKIQAINTYALPVIRYPAGIVSWTKEEMEAAHVKTRKLLTMHRGFYPKSNANNLRNWS